jgi:cysteinyl-tRNA synthetase
MSAALTRLKRLVIAIAALKNEATLDDAMVRPLQEAGYGKGAPFDWQRRMLEDSLSSEALLFVARFDEVMSNDLMTPQALPVLDAMLAAPLLASEKLRLIASFDLALGLGLLDFDRRALSVRPEAASLSAIEVDALLDERQQARVARDFAAADAARDRLKSAGVEIMDGDPQRWEWRPLLDD